jgi:hypothetical protein
MNLDDIFDGKPLAPEAEPAAGSADRAAEAPASSDAAPDTAPSPGAEPAADAETAPEGGTVPVGALQAERRERQDWKERAIREEEQRKALERELAQLRAGVPAQQAPTAPMPVQIPDPITDPQGYHQAMMEQHAQRVWSDKLDLSEDMAREAHGDEKVEAAQQAFKAAVAKNPGLYGELQAQRNPYGWLMKWHAKQQAKAEIGDDPQAYRAKLEAELRAKWEAEQGFAASAAPAAPRNAPVLPPSLAGMRSAAPRGSTPFTGPTPLKELFPN